MTDWRNWAITTLGAIVVLLFGLVVAYNTSQNSTQDAQITAIRNSVQQLELQSATATGQSSLVNFQLEQLRLSVGRIENKLDARAVP